jgi:tetratricopeptide (TPR) repeat protein
MYKLIVVFTLLFTYSFSQNNNVIGVVDNNFSYDSIVYVKARANADYSTAINALYYMMAKKPYRSIAYKDSLTCIYYLTQAYQKCILIGNEVLSHQPDNLHIMERVAISERLVGNIKSSLEMYEKLYLKTTSLVHAYYIAEMQFYLQRYGECMTTLEKIISSENSKNEKIELTVNSKSKQMVSLAAAALNIKGMAYNELGKKDAAKEAFKSALLLEKDFILPKSNLEQLGKK